MSDLKVLLTYVVTISVERYNPDTNIWTRVADMHSNRKDAGVGMLNNNLYVVGGIRRASVTQKKTYRKTQK